MLEETGSGLVAKANTPGISEENAVPWIEKLFRWSRAIDQEKKTAQEFWRDAKRAGVRVALVADRIRAHNVVREAAAGQLRLVSPARAQSELASLSTRSASQPEGVDLVCVLGSSELVEECERHLKVPLPVMDFLQGYLSGEFRARVNGLHRSEDNPSVSYILATARRTGSTLLCHLLEACGNAGHPGEYLDVKRYALSMAGRLDPGKTFQQSLAWSQTPNGVFGANIHWSSLQQFQRLIPRFTPDEKKTFERILARSQYVFLTRKNKLRQAISDWRAKNTDVYQLYDDDPRSIRARHLHVPPYNFTELCQHLRLLVEDELGWKSYFLDNGVTPLAIFYEDLTRDRLGTVNRVLDFLGLEAPVSTPVTHTEELADDFTEEYYQRFRTEFEAEFDLPLALEMAGEPLELKASQVNGTSNPDGKHVLVTLATRDFLDRAKQFFSSAFHNGCWDGDFALLAHDVPDSELTWFHERGVAIKQCSPIYPHAVGGMDPSLTSKYFLFTDFFRRWETVIYSDLDIIFKAPIQELKTVRGFRAVDDWSPALIEQILSTQDALDRGLDPARFRDLKQELARTYNLYRRPFCAGFFAFSSDLIDEGTFQHLVDLTDRFGAISKFGDQLILNLYFYELWKSLNPAYNILVRQQTAYDRITITETRWGKMDEVHSYILHLFEPKPWDPRSSFYLEWLSNFLKADSVVTGYPPPADPVALRRVQKTERRIRLRQRAYDVLEHFGRWKLPVIRTLHFFDSRLQLMLHVGRFLTTRARDQ